MAWGLLLALCGALLAPAAAGGRHSLAVLVTAVTQEDGTHHYFMISKLDDVQIAYYSSDTREVRPTQTWAEQAVGAEYLQEKTRDFWGYEEGTKVETRRWMQLHNQTGGVHTEQLHVTCALSGQAPVDPRFQYAYDGRDFISFDAQMGTWVAAMQPAFAQKQSWETGKTWTQFVQHYLQSECLGTLRSLVQRGRAVLEQQVSPQVSVSRRDTPDGSVTLSCCAGAFTHVPSTSPGCGTEKTSWRRRTPVGSCPTPTTPTTGSRPWRSPRSRTTGTATPAGWSTAAGGSPRSSGPLGRRAPCPWGSWPPSSWPCCFWLEP